METNPFSSINSSSDVLATNAYSKRLRKIDQRSLQDMKGTKLVYKNKTCNRYEKVKLHELLTNATEVY